MYFVRTAKFLKNISMYISCITLFEIFLFGVFSPSRFFYKNSWTCFSLLISSCLICLIFSFLFFRKINQISIISDNSERLNLLESMRIPFYISMFLLVFISTLSSHFFDLCFSGTLTLVFSFWILIMLHIFSEGGKKILGKNENPLIQ